MGFLVGGIRETQEMLDWAVNNVRTTIISPGAVVTELPETISGAELKSGIEDFYQVAIPAESIARAIAYAIEEPSDVAINEMIIRPTSQER